jgi:hypothetical protein
MNMFTVNGIRVNTRIDGACRRAVADPGHVSVPKAAHIANIRNAAGFNQGLGDFLEGK